MIMYIIYFCLNFCCDKLPLIIRHDIEWLNKQTYTGKCAGSRGVFWGQPSQRAAQQTVSELLVYKVHFQLCRYNNCVEVEICWKYRMLKYIFPSFCFLYNFPLLINDPHYLFACKTGIILNKSINKY